MTTTPTTAEPPEWIDDPHDIEQGMMKNPAWAAWKAAEIAQPATPEPAKRWAQCPETDTPCSICPTLRIPCEATQVQPDSRDFFEFWCNSVDNEVRQDPDWDDHVAEESFAAGFRAALSAQASALQAAIPAQQPLYASPTAQSATSQQTKD